jgi:hypothetical protein
VIVVLMGLLCRVASRGRCDDDNKDMIETGFGNCQKS